jgi:uncharacterized protein involved in response to NO
MSSLPFVASAPPASPPLGAFRPLFLAASLFAGVGMLLWGGFLHLGWLPRSVLPPLLWHGHAMLFGFGGALIGGFLLTAAANWTGRATASTPLLLALCAAWLAARIALLSPLPLWVGAAFDLAYLLGVAALLARAIVAARNRRNYFVIGMLLVYAGLDLAFYLGALRDPALAARALLWTLDWMTLLMLVMGGRVIPFFTRRRLPGVAADDRRWLAVGVNAGAALALVLDVCGAPASWRGAAWLGLSLLVLLRLAGWRGWSTRREPMLWSLHLGYAWLSAGTALRGLAVLGVWARPETSALHGITVGALGTLALAMMTRVAQGHSGAPIRASRWLTAAFVLPSLAALLRLAGPPALWTTAATAWAAAYLIYAAAIGPLLVRGKSAAA